MIAWLAVSIVQLIAVPVSRSAADVAGGGDHGLDQPRRDFPVVACDVRDLRAVGAHGPSLLLTERVRKHEVGLVAAGGTDEREGDSGRTGGVFNHGAAPWHPAPRPRARDHCQ